MTKATEQGRNVCETFADFLDATPLSQDNITGMLKMLHSLDGEGINQCRDHTYF